MDRPQRVRSTTVQGLSVLAAMAGTSFCLSLWGQSSQLQLGKEVYGRICAECHGEDGQGRGPEARRLRFRARDFSHGSFKCRCTPTGALPTDADLLRSVTEGLPGSPMKARGDELTVAERRAVIEYVKTFSDRFTEETPPPCIPIPDPIAHTEETTAEGRQIYRLLSCWSCHGKEGRADGPAAKGLRDAWGDPIKVHNFVLMKQFKCGNEDRDLYRTMHTGLNGTPMPSYTDSFLFGSDSIRDDEPFLDAFGTEAVRRLQDYLSQQLPEAQIHSLSEADRQALIEKRSWSLVHYLKSLLRPARP